MHNDARLQIAFDTFLFVVMLAALLVSVNSGWRFYSALMPSLFAGFGVATTGLVLLRDILRARRGQLQVVSDDEDAPPSIAVTLLPALLILVWMGAIYVATFAIGLMPSVAIGTVIYLRFVAKATWTVTLATAAVMMVISYLVYGQLISTVWPRSLLGGFLGFSL